METLQRRNKTLLYEDVVNDLYELIDLSGLKPGDKLPTERELTDQLGISRNVLREAFHVLERRGVISSRQGKGRFLRVIPQESESADPYQSLTRGIETYSLRDAYEVRKVLEVKAVELVVQNADDKDLAELDVAFENMQLRFHDTGKTVGEFEMHRLYARKSGSMFLESILDIVMSSIYDMMHSRRVDILTSHDPEKELDAHRQILEAIRKRDAEGAMRCMASHLQDTIEMIK